MKISYKEVIKKEIELIEMEYIATNLRERKVYLHNLWKSLEIKLKNIDKINCI